MTPGTLVALIRPVQTVGGGDFPEGFVLEVACLYPDQGRLGGDFLSLKSMELGQVILQGVRPDEVHVISRKEMP